MPPGSTRSATRSGRPPWARRCRRTAARTARRGSALQSAASTSTWGSSAKSSRRRRQPGVELGGEDAGVRAHAGAATPSRHRSRCRTRRGSRRGTRPVRPAAGRSRSGRTEEARLRETANAPHDVRDLGRRRSRRESLGGRSSRHPRRFARSGRGPRGRRYGGQTMRSKLVLIAAVARPERGHLAAAFGVGALRTESRSDSERAPPPLDPYLSAQQPGDRRDPSGGLS